MAILHEDHYPEPTYSLEITPLEIPRVGREDPYRVILRDQDQVVFSETCHGHADGMGHYYLSLIGEAFRGTRAILDTQLQFVSSFDDAYETPAAVQVGSYFVTLYLAGYRGDDGAEWIDVDIFLADDWSRPPTGFITGYRKAFLRCSAAAAERFGRELLQELRDVSDADLARYRNEAKASG